MILYVIDSLCVCVLGIGGACEIPYFVDLEEGLLRFFMFCLFVCVCFGGVEVCVKFYYYVASFLWLE